MDMAMIPAKTAEPVRCHFGCGLRWAQVTTFGGEHLWAMDMPRLVDG